MRTVNFTKHENFSSATDNGPLKELHACIGFFVDWAEHNERYAHLTLYGDKNGNLNATYRNAVNEVTYGMYSERREDGTYSTHS